jgi:beta-aspartyl-peptidase (threonine type)
MNTLRRIACALLLLLSAAALQAQSTAAPNSDAPAAKEAIRAVLEASRVAWNRGDLKGFMQSYWNSPELTFFGGARQSSGWKQTLEGYEAAYKGPGKEMGRLEFNNMHIEVLGDDAALVTAAWQLTVKDGTRRQGLTTLIFRRLPEGWRIIHDHSS